MDKEFMEIAINEARKSKETPKCGAVIVKNGQVTGRGFNTQVASNDASAHAEINAIRGAGKNLGNKRLDDCVIYCTCEPCTMCLSAIVFARISRIVYGVNLKDVSSGFFDTDIDTFLAKAPRRIRLTKNFMEKECKKSLV